MTGWQADVLVVACAALDAEYMCTCVDALVLCLAKLSAAYSARRRSSTHKSTSKRTCPVSKAARAGVQVGVLV